MGKGFSDWTPMLKSGFVEMAAFCDADYSMRDKAQRKLAKEGNTMIIPSDLANVAGFIKAASAVIKKA